MSRETNRRSSLSVAMIAKDAGPTIAASLLSVQGIADEILVLDTGSTDDTATMARRNGARVIQSTWQDSFSVSRNECLAHVQGDWILWLDASERFTEQGARSLREYVDREADPSKAYRLLIKIPRHHSNIADEQISRIRLVPNQPAIHFVGRVPQRLHESLAAENIEIDALPILIHRDQREHDARIKSQRARRNVCLAELEIQEVGRNPRLLVVMGDALQDLGQRDEAIRWYRDAADCANHGSAEQLEAYYGLLTSLDGENRHEEQLRVCVDALDVFPLDAQLLCAMGGYLQAQNRWDLATRSYQTAFRHGKVHPETWHLDDLKSITAVCLSLSLQVQEQDDRAVELLKGAIADDPQSNRLGRALIDFHVKHENLNQAVDQVDRLPLGFAERKALRDVVRGAILASRKKFEDARPLLRIAFDNGCRDTFCLRWLTVTLLALDEREAVARVLEQWRMVDPANREILSYSRMIPGGSSGDNSIDRTLRIDQGQDSAGIPVRLPPAERVTGNSSPEVTR